MISTELFKTTFDRVWQESNMPGKICHLLGRRLLLPKDYEIRVSYAVNKYTVTVAGVVVENSTEHKTHITVGQFSLRPLPGCSAILVSHGEEVSPLVRGVGLGYLFHNLRFMLGKALNCAELQCTVQDTNTRQLHILQKQGWRIEATFLNPQTNHTVVKLSLPLI